MAFAYAFIYLQSDFPNWQRCVGSQQGTDMEESANQVAVHAFTGASCLQMLEKHKEISTQ